MLLHYSADVVSCDHACMSICIIIATATTRLTRHQIDNTTSRGMQVGFRVRQLALAASCSSPVMSKLQCTTYVKMSRTYMCDAGMQCF